MTDRRRRKLTAIVAADVAGYSRLIGLDEEGTLETLRKIRHDIVGPLLNEHGGRVANTAGDSLLLEFSSVVDAVRCALAMQRGMAERNADVPDERRLIFRVGIHIGDVVSEGDDLLGDGVNVAARLEGLAEAGGIALSDDAYRQVRDRVDVAWRDGGEHELKNITRPVRVWRWPAQQTEAKPRSPTASGPHPMLADKPSIVVLPFTNMSGDPEQDYFADGLAEDIITELSRYRWFFVIARNSSFVYKGRAVDLSTVERELGVRYVLEGGVRKSGERLRITAQLIETATGNHLWAEKYDGNLAEVFDLQDEITQKIVATLPGRIEAAQAERVVRKPPKDMAAYELLLAAKVLHHRATVGDNAEALDLVERAIDIDPGFAQAYAWKGCLIGQAVARGFVDRNPHEHLKRAFDCVMKGLALDENDIECHRVLCEAFMAQRAFDSARAHHERAFALNPNDPRIVAQRGELMTWLGKPEEGVEWLQMSMRLDPFGIRQRSHLLGRALLASHRYEEAVDAYCQSAYQHRFEPHADLAAALAQAGRREEAEAEVIETLRIKPDFSVASYIDNLAYMRQSDREHHGEVLVQAGLPA